MLLLRKYLVSSLALHLIIIIITSLVALSTQHIKQTFIVLGAHSKKSSAVSYKSFKSVVPFVLPTKTQSIPAPKRTAQTTTKKSITSTKSTLTKKASLKKNALIKELGTRSSQKSKKKIVAEKKQLERKKTQADVKKQAIVPKTPIQEKKAPKQKPEKKIESIEQTPVSTPQSLSSNDQPPQQSEPLQQDIKINPECDLGTITLGDSQPEHISEYEKTINSEAARVWRPPFGVSQGTTCFVTFIIAQDGTHENELTQSSCVIIYDLSVMRAARAMKFPKSLWGKQFKIAFRQ